ncbi:MAG: hypothetical protein R3F20_16855 [Planctomycetota bacterium]
MNTARVIAFLAIFATLAVSARAQFGLGSKPDVVIKNATVLVNGEFVKGCHVVIAGKRIKAVGRDVEIASDAEVIDGQGRYVIPSLIDASTMMGIATRANSQAPRHLATDALDPYGLETWQDALEAGVGYAYLAGNAARGAGGRGQVLRTTASADADLAAAVLDGTDAIHFKVGTNSSAIGRRGEIDALRKYLEGARKYKESWEKYEEDLAQYEKDLAEWAKKNPGKTAPDKKDEKKAEAAPAAKPGAAPARRRRPTRRPGGAIDSRLLGGFRLGFPVPGLENCTDENCNIVGVHDEHDHASLTGEDHEDHDHEGGGFPEKPEPGVLAIFADPPQLAPRPTFLDDGTEPHLRWPEPPSRVVASEQRTATCPHCGSDDPLAPAHIAHAQPFPADEFEWVGDELADRYLERFGFAPEHAEGDGHDDHDADHDDDHDSAFGLAREDEPKGAPAGAKKDDAKGAKEKDGRPKKPVRPAVNPDLEEVAKALAGKVGVRIEVHRAEDILGVLEILDDIPMEVALEGVTEGRFVAEELAKAEVSVIVDGEPSAPTQEIAGGPVAGGAPSFPFPRGGRAPRGMVRAAGYSIPLEGEGDPANAAILARAGVPIVVASMGDESSGLLDRAAYLASLGLSDADALRAVTERAARVLHLEGLGAIGAGKLASLVVFDGNPFLAASRVERVYLEGKVAYQK